MTDHPDVLGRLAAVGAEAMYVYCRGLFGSESWETLPDRQREHLTKMAQIAQDALVRELASMVDSDVLAAAAVADLKSPICDRCEGMDLYDRSPENCFECAMTRVRAAAGVLLAPSVAEIGRLRSVLAEIASKKSLCVPRVWQMAEEALRDK